MQKKYINERNLELACLVSLTWHSVGSFVHTVEKIGRVYVIELRINRIWNAWEV